MEWRQNQQYICQGHCAVHTWIQNPRGNRNRRSQESNTQRQWWDSPAYLRRVCVRESQDRGDIGISITIMSDMQAGIQALSSPGIGSRIVWEWYAVICPFIYQVKLGRWATIWIKTTVLWCFFLKCDHELNWSYLIITF